MPSKNSLQFFCLLKQQLCLCIWNSEREPTEWKEGVILSFYKNKSDRRNTASDRPITLQYFGTLLGCHSHHQQLREAYVIPKATFDSQDRNALWLRLQRLSVPYKYINIVQDFYIDATCKVCAEEGHS